MPTAFTMGTNYVQDSTWAANANISAMPPHTSTVSKLPAAKNAMTAIADMTEHALPSFRIETPLSSALNAL